jgi:hypothetical protein
MDIMAKNYSRNRLYVSEEKFDLGIEYISALFRDAVYRRLPRTTYCQFYGRHISSGVAPKLRNGLEMFTSVATLT